MIDLIKYFLVGLAFCGAIGLIAACLAGTFGKAGAIIILALIAVPVLIGIGSSICHHDDNYI